MWYFVKDGQPFGPVGTEALNERFSSGALRPIDLVWQPGMDTWAQASTLAELWSERCAPPLLRGLETDELASHADYARVLLKVCGSICASPRERICHLIVRVPFQKVAAVLLYLLATTGISLLGLKLSSAVAERAMILALPHLENGPPKRSLIEQRRLDAMFAVPPLPGGASRRVTALEAPSRPANILATRLDLAEREDTSYSSFTPSTAEPSRVRVTRSRHDDLSAGDIFNRSFGVLTVAAN
jgi:hypothetical protein